MQSITKMRDEMRRKTTHRPVGGFQLVGSKTLMFETADKFREALEMQRESIVTLDCREFGDGGLEKIDLNGGVAGTDYLLSKAAFGDLCNFSKVPSGFIKRLAMMDGQKALDVLTTCIKSTFHRGKKKSLVVDTRSKRIEGIVGMDTYQHLPNADVYDYAMTASDDMEFTNGWLQGPTMRTTIIDKNQTVEPQVSDIVRLGMSVESAINGDMSVKVASYCERLVCSNGMTRRDDEHVNVVQHTGDVDLRVQQAAVDCARKSKSFIDRMSMSTTRLIKSVKEFEEIQDYISASRNGGSAQLMRTSIELAQEEAYTEGRVKGELSLWNVVNGVTAAAHRIESVQNRVRAEQLGFDVLDEFVSRN